MEKPSRMQKLIKTFQANNQQLAFGSYAAELSYYVILAIIPLMLALANVIALLPISEAEIIKTIELALPAEIEAVLIPLLESYLTGTSSSIFSLSLIISFWPASNVFNTLQRLLNRIYKTEARKNFFISRLFAYAFTLVVVISTVIFVFAVTFGQQVLQFLQEFLEIDLLFLTGFVEDVWLIGLAGIFLLVMSIYYFMPNVNWKIKYVIPGTIFTVLGFITVSQLFTLYLSFAANNIGSGTIGVFIVLMIWLYLNALVIAIGAYINVFYHDYKEKSYWNLVEETSSYQSFRSSSPNYQPSATNFKNVIFKINPENDTEKGEIDDIYSSKS